MLRLEYARGLNVAAMNVLGGFNYHIILVSNAHKF